MAPLHEKYKGKTITVILKSNQQGWTWAFQINGGMARTRGETASSPKEAVAQAVAAAKDVIDRPTTGQAAA